MEQETRDTDIYIPGAHTHVRRRCTRPDVSATETGVQHVLREILRTITGDVHGLISQIQSSNSSY